MTQRHQISAMQRRIVGATIAASLLASLSACAPGGADATSSGDTAKSVSVVDPGKLTCAMSGEYRPFNFYDDSNKLVGFDVDVCTAVAKELGLEAAPVTGAFNTLIAGLVGNRYDAIIGSMASTDERKKEVDFSDPYYSTGAQLFVAKGSPVEDVTGLKDAKVGVALGTTFEEYAHGLDGVGEVKTYQADIDALRDLGAGRIDAVITQGFMGRFLAKSAELKAEAVGDVLFPDVASIPVSKDNSKLLSAINAALKTMHEDGTYKEISMKWFATDIS